ncbi:hypothetical protein [Nocardioides renjunii]|uniref:hypothetical protein n=1 Tax=Nocardioides renjunii TaxID=3095075 RepID=UPI002AFDDDDA|nr:hypothetical protein [Nocardioides sp. S-34]WQQ20662.1 hypothetical protein SHK17_12195 [Nocardioides sp. S-34]
MLELFVALTLLAGNARYAGTGVAPRFRALSDDRARVTHESFTTHVQDWLLFFNVVASSVSAALAAYQQWWLGVLLSSTALAVSVVARVLRRSARSNILAGFAERDLEPLHPRETSRRRERRQLQLAGVALVGYVTFRVMSFVAEESGDTWPAVAGFVGMILTAGGALGLVGSMAWRFGDERPASDRSSDLP